MNTSRNKWEKKRAIVVGRQSNDKHGTGSTRAQIDHINQKLLAADMLMVDDIPLEGVSAVSPARITEVLEQLFERKKTKNDFDVIAWQIEDRATRGGGKFGMWLEHEAECHGLEVYFADSDLGDMPYAPVVRVAKYEAAKEESVGKGMRTTQGQDLAKKTGFFRTAGPTPLGCHRLYLDENDKPKFFIRNFGNGLQEQVEYASKVVIGRYGSVGKRSQHRFKKQRIEYSLLIPGDRERRRVVRVIFFLRYKRGWRGCKIADYLNRLNIPAPRGGDWSQRQCESIYENEAYTGVTYNDQTFSGRFFRRDKVLGFTALDRHACELALRKTFSPKLRPMDEWDRIDQPYMYDFLPHDVRDLAITAQARMWKNRLDPTRPKKKSNGSPASTYLFSNKLTAKQDGGKLVGTLSGDGIEYYRHKKGRKGRRKGSVLNRLIAAKPLHEAAAQLLAEVLLDEADLRTRLCEYVIEQRSRTGQEAPGVPELLAERDELSNLIQLTVRSLTGAALADAKHELVRLGARRNEIEARLKEIDHVQKNDNRPVEKVVDDAIAVLAEDSRRLLTLAGEPFRDAVNLLIPSLSVDMETKEVELNIALPVWAAAAKPKPRKRSKKAEQEVCLSTSSQSLSCGWTQVIFATARCEYTCSRGRRITQPCYTCRRVAA